MVRPEPLDGADRGRRVRRLDDLSPARAAVVVRPMTRIDECEFRKDDGDLAFTGEAQTILLPQPENRKWTNVIEGSDPTGAPMM